MSGALYGAEVVADSVLGYWALTETSGTTATDASGHGVHGAYTTTVSGQCNLAAASELFPGGGATADFQGGFVLMPDSATISPTTSVTLEVWCRFTGAAWPSEACPIGRYYSHYMIDIIGGGFRFYTPPVGGNPDSGVSLNRNQTYYLVATYDGPTGYKRWYVDGVEVASAVAAAGTNLLPGVGQIPLNIGSYQSGAYLWTGPLGHAAIYGSALSAERVAAHYAAAMATEPVYAMTASVARDRATSARRDAAASTARDRTGTVTRD